MADLVPGAAVGPFVIEGVIGRGGMGVVYRAHDQRLSRSVALKVVSPHLAETADYRDRFITEARSAASVEHRGIVPIFEVDEAAGQLYIAMRLIDGEDLAAYAKRRAPMSVAEALRVLAPVAEALDAAAKRGLVHRDVKPSNILVADPESASPEVLLSDFGLAKTQGDAGRTQTGQFVGSVDYVAPEQIATGIVDGRSDQYALACVFYELLSGAPPFRRDQPMQTLFAQVNDPIPALLASRPELPAKIDAALARGLAKNPDDRYGTAAGMLNAIAAAAGEPPVAHESSAALPRLTQPAATIVQPAAPMRGRRKRLAVGIGVGVVAALLAGGVAVVLTQRGGASESAEQTSVTAMATTSAADLAATKAKQTAALQAAFDAQREFVRTNNAYDNLNDECEKMDGAAFDDCSLESTRLAERKALRQKAGDVAGQLPTLLEEAQVGDAEGCRSMVTQFVDQAEIQDATYERLLRVARRDEGVNVPDPRANYKYRAQFVSGEIAPAVVNRFGVLVACQPAANWTIPDFDSEIRLDAARSYFVARYSDQLDTLALDLCDYLVEGKYSDIPTLAAAQRTCWGRTLNPRNLRRKSREMSAYFGRLVEANSWVDITTKCRVIIKSNIEIMTETLNVRADYDTALPTDANEEVFSRFREHLAAIDVNKAYDQEVRFMSCLTPKGVRPT